jgi:hypothetical protein
MVNCKFCKGLFVSVNKGVSQGWTRFCSLSCSTKYSWIGRPKGSSQERARRHYQKVKDTPEYKKRVREYSRKYRSFNRDKARASWMARYAAKLQRTPVWADLKAIEKFYKNCPKGHHVDHIVPLQGKEVSGLHVEHNLQYLTASENCRKSNKLLAGVQAGPINTA